jgi:hypothetical protein
VTVYTGIPQSWWLAEIYGWRTVWVVKRPTLAVIGYPPLWRDHDEIVAAGRARGLVAEVVSPARLSVALDEGGVQALVDGETFVADAVLPRGVNRIYPFLATWLRASGAAVILVPVVGDD